MSELQQPGGISMEQSTHSAMHGGIFLNGILFPNSHFSKIVFRTLTDVGKPDFLCN